MKHKGKKKASPGRAARRPAQPEIQYPIATVAYYGPDDRTVTKIAVGIIESEGAPPIVECWHGPDVMANAEVQLQVIGFIEAHGVKQVAVTDGPIGCPHEEGVDYPLGQACPQCPFWHTGQAGRAKRGAQDVAAYGLEGGAARQVIQLIWDKAQADQPPAGEAAHETDVLGEMKTLTRLRLRLIWERAQLGMPLDDEEARLAKVLQEHPEYSDLWGQLDELPDEDIERDGVNPVLHVNVHAVIENQIAAGSPKAVRQVVGRLVRRGLSRHAAIHRVGCVLSEEIFDILRDKRPFDEAGYAQRLYQLLNATG